MLDTLLLRLRQKITFAGVALHRREGYAPFFIIGSGRSGNTLLRRILNNHSELFIPPETYVLGRSIRQALHYPQMSWPDLAELVYGNFQFHQEFETFGMRSLEELYRTALSTPKGERSVAYLLNAFYDRYREEHGISSGRWGDKTPQNTFALNELCAVFPDAKFIHIVRNPYDAAASYVKAGLYADYAEAAWRWRKSVENAVRFAERYPHACMEVAYSELVSDPEVVTKRICDFLEMTFEPSMLQTAEGVSLGDVEMHAHHARVMEPIDTKRIGAGMKSLSSEERGRICAVLNASKDAKVRAMAQKQQA